MIRIPPLGKLLNLPRLTQPQMKRLTILFHSWVLFYLLNRVYKEYLVKSRGGTDSLGVRWKELSESRRIYKPLRRGEIPGRERRRIRDGVVSKKEALANRNPPINIDTGRLLNSLKPGKIIAGEYQSQNPDQEVQVTERGIGFRVLVPYADEVEAVRPFLPGNWEPWLEEAINLALNEIKREFQMITGAILNAIKTYLNTLPLFTVAEKTWEYQITSEEKPFPTVGQRVITAYPVRMIRDSMKDQQIKFIPEVELCLSRRIKDTDYSNQENPIYSDVPTSLVSLTEILGIVLDSNLILTNLIRSSIISNKDLLVTLLETSLETNSIATAAQFETIGVIGVVKTAELIIRPIERQDAFFLGF